MCRWCSLSLGVLLLLTAGLGRAEEACRTCHPDVKIEYQAGAHAGRFDCTGCHGGDPLALEIEEAHSIQKGYSGTPKRSDVPALCASCHADPVRMRPYGLTTDQYTQYQASGHGVRLAQGDMRVAVCTDCHGAHLILGRGEPTSPVARHNIPATCAKCHANAELMASYRLPTNQADAFRESVHGQALFVRNHPTAPTCATCHGAHGAQSPGAGSITAVCGHCHARTREFFKQGAHGKAAAEGAISECITCHGYHDTPVADRTLFERTCSQCHAEDSKERAIGVKLVTLLNRAEESIQSAATEIDRVERVFPTVARYRPRLRQARAHLMEALPEQHVLSVERLEDHTRQARFIADEVRSAVHGVEEAVRVRYVVLALVWVFLLFLAGVAYLCKAERHRINPEP